MRRSLRTKRRIRRGNLIIIGTLEPRQQRCRTRHLYPCVLGVFGLGFCFALAATAVRQEPANLLSFPPRLIYSAVEFSQA